MVVPTRSECLLLLQQVKMPPHIQRHSFMVARIALCLGRLLNMNSIRLDLQLLEAGSLLHDIGKPRGISTGERHEELGAVILERWGHGLLAHIVREHVSMDVARANGPITESVLVNYADKRVRHDQVVTLEDRFFDLMNRYAKTSIHRANMQEKLKLFLRLEQRIFEHLTIKPAGTELMSLSLESTSEGGEYSGRQENHCGIAGRREVC